MDLDKGNKRSITSFPQRDIKDQSVTILNWPDQLIQKFKFAHCFNIKLTERNKKCIK